MRHWYDTGMTEILSQIVIYTRPDCSYSDALKDELDADKINYSEIDLSVHPEKIDEAIELAGGERITPVLRDGDVVTIGFRGLG